MIKNKRQKGNRNRRKAIDILTNEGWTVGIVERTGRFIFPKDLYGLFDLVAVKGCSVLFLQISTNRPHSHKPFKEFRKKVVNESPLLLEQWCFIDGGEVKKWQY